MEIFDDEYVVKFADHYIGGNKIICGIIKMQVASTRYLVPDFTYLGLPSSQSLIYISSREIAWRSDTRIYI